MPGNTWARILTQWRVKHYERHRTETTSDHAIALLFSVVRRIPHNDRLVRAGHWDATRAMPRRHLCGGMLGLVGFGRIGRRVAQKVAGFEMLVLAFDPYVPKEEMEELGVQPATLEELLQSADFVSLHTPLTSDTHHLIGERELRRMRPEAFLVNCARGAVVDEQALYRARTEGWIAGAGLDLMERDPPDPGNPLLQLDNVVVNPHTASYSELSAHETWRLAAETIIDLRYGIWPRSIVNPNVKPRRKLESRKDLERAQ